MADRTTSSDSSSDWSNEDQKRRTASRKVNPHAPDMKVMRAVKELFHGRHKATFQVVPESERCSVHPQIVYGSLTENIDALVAANQAGASVGMCINQMDGEGRTKKNVRKIRAVWVDVDRGFDQKVFLPFKPSALVGTSEDRGHALWLVRRCDAKTYARVQQALAKRFGGDPGITDPGRAVRMAGTLHHKSGAVLTKLHYLDKLRRRISISKLIRQLGLEVADEQADAPSMAESSPGHVEAKVRSAIDCIPASSDRRFWLKIGMAVHDALPNQTGYMVWTEWSQKSAKFEEKDQRRTWKGFKNDGGRTVASLYREAKKNGWVEHETAAELGWEATELGLVDHFAKLAEGKLCFDVAQKQWLVFDSPVWRPDEPRAINQARRILQGLTADAESKGALSACSLLKKYASVPGLRALLNHATANASLNVEPSRFDAMPNQLAVLNGAVDLETGQLATGGPAALLRRQAPVVYDPDANAPKFLRFIDFVTRGDSSYAGFLQRVAGYSLFGHAREQVFFCLVGSGGNGKGVLIRRLEAVLGDHVVAVAPNLLTKAYSGNPNAPTPAFMALHGARIVQCGEGEDGKRFDSAFVKQLTGNDKITGRAGYGEQAQFTPICTLWLSANALPDVDDQDQAMWRRLLILPFRAKVKRPDPAFEPELDAENSGILNWLIAGALAYTEQGLSTCDAVVTATQRARRKSDSVQSWLDERCKLKSTATLQASAAFQDYASYCRRSGRHQLSVHAFNRALISKGHVVRKTNRFNVYSGLRLNE
jgi:putative DNA primase/helicase